MNIKDSYIHNGTAVLKDIKIENSILKKILAGKDANDAYLDWTTVLDLTTIKPTNAGNADTLGSYAHTAFLKLTGGTMTGKIDVSYNNSSILDSNHGLNFAQVAHIGIANTDFGIYTTGGIYLRPNQTWGSANSNGLVITSSAITYNGNSLLHAGNYTLYVYSKSTSDSRYVLKAGDTMTGALTVPSLTVTGASSFSLAINGNILGNAATASRWLNGRKLTLSGKITGNVTFDGSADFTLTTATNFDYVSALGKSGSTITWSKNGTAQTALDFSTTFAPYNSNGYLPLNGGTLTGNLIIGSTSTNKTLIVHGTTTLETTSYGTQLEIWRRMDNANAVISYYNGTTKTLLGLIGISGDTSSGVSSYGRPYWYNGTTNYQLVHSTTKTAVGGTTTPVYVDANGQVQAGTALGTMAYASTANYVTTSTAQTISGNKTFSGSTSLDDATIGNLVVNGGASFALTINGTIDKALKDGSGNTITFTYVKKSGDTMTGLLTTTTGNNHNGIKVGNTYINSINGELILLNNTSIRFGGDSWDYNVWAGLKYVHSSKIIYLGLADGSVFTANSALSGGKLYTPGISNIYIGNGTLTVYHTGNLSIGTLMGSTAIGDSDEPVYWSGSAFVKAGAYPTKASWNYDDVYLKLSGGTITGELTLGNREVDTAPSSETAVTRLTITPYYHTGGPWYIKSSDDSSSAFLKLFYGGSELLKIKHDGTFMNTLKANITGSATNADKVDGYHAGVNNGDVSIFVPWPSDNTMKNEGLMPSEYGTSEYGYPDEVYLKSICKWAIAHYVNSGDVILIGSISPNSSGTCILHLYSSSGKDSTTLLPRYCSGTYTTLSGYIYNFGTHNYNWYYRQVSAGYASSAGSATTATYASNVGAAGTAGTNYVTAANVISMYNWYNGITATDESSNTAIDKWNEIVSFLAGITDTSTLSGILAGYAAVGHDHDGTYLKLSNAGSTETITGLVRIKDDLGGNLSNWVTYQHSGPFEVGRSSNAMTVAIGVTDDNYGYIQTKGINITTPGDLVLLPGGGNLYYDLSKKPILHSGNYSNYALPLSGGTMTGVLTTPGLTVTGASTFSLAINGSILGNAATASRLLNVRTITVGSTSKSFDGSANISFTLSEIGALAAGSYVTISGTLTISGAKTFSNNVVIGNESANKNLEVHGTGTFETTTFGSQLEVWRKAAGYSSIKYSGGTDKTLLGYIGITHSQDTTVGSCKPFWGNGTNSYKLVWANANSTTSVGGTTTPIYIDANGQAQTCTSYANASVNYATSAGSVAWANVTNHPTKLSEFTDDLGSSPTHTHSQYLGKITYEWNKAIDFGSTGYLLIGKFPMYDSNVTIDIDSTTSTTYHGTAIIATQNINTSRGGTFVCKVYGDALNTVADSLVVQYSSGSNKFNVYFKPQGWSKNVIHVRATGLAAAPTESEICTIVDSVPTTDLVTVTNVLTTTFLGISAKASDSDKLDGQDGSYYATASSLDSYVTLSTAQTISGNKTFSSSVTIDSLTAGNLVVTGGASFALTINGNAATASKLATARTISLTGSVTGSGSFDGSGNLSIDTTTNHSHSYLFTEQLSATQTNITWAQGYGNNRSFVYNTSGVEWSYLFGLRNDKNYGAILKMGYSDKYLRILRVEGGTWKSTDWEKISAGYADSAGSADSVAWSGVTNVPYTYVFNTSHFTHDPSTKKFTCSGGNENTWDKQVYSKIGYKECKVTYHIGQTNKYIMVGLNSDPTTNASYTSIDYCWYTQSGGTLTIYEDGSPISSISGHTTYAVGDELSIEYSEGTVRYYHNGVLCRSVDRSYGNMLYFDSSFYQTGGYIYDVSFEPIGTKSSDAGVVSTTKNCDLKSESWLTNVITLPTTIGSYLLTLICDNSTLTGVFSIGSSDSAKDEINLHLHGSGPRLYARTNGAVLELASSDTTATTRSVTIKYKRLI